MALMQIRWTAEKYPPVWQCIYCGELDRSKMTDEHIVPFGLLPKGGDWFLPKASCTDCAGITKKFEDRCLQYAFGSLRQQFQLKSRRKKDGRVTAKYRGHNGEITERIVDVRDLPRAAVGFRWPIPGIVLGEPPTAKFTGDMVVRYDQKAFLEHLSDQQALSVGRVAPLDFARMLAKIGHSYAVAKFGAGSFEPLLRDVILDRSEAAPFLIGGDHSGVHPDDQPGVLHDVFRSDVRRENGPSFFGVSIRLFALMGTPRYHVIVGTNPIPSSEALPTVRVHHQM
jgi:hypothetical protein